MMPMADPARGRPRTVPSRSDLRGPCPPVSPGPARPSGSIGADASVAAGASGRGRRQAEASSGSLTRGASLGFARSPDRPATPGLLRRSGSFGFASRAAGRSRDDGRRAARGTSRRRRRGRRCGAGRERLARLGLERLERAQRAHELGQRGAAVTQQRGQGAGAVAIADQRETEVALPAPLMAEQLGLDPIGPLQPPGGDRRRAARARPEARLRAPAPRAAPPRAPRTPRHPRPPAPRISAPAARA